MGGPQSVALQSVVRARSETEAAWMVAEARPGTRLIAGGTDLMLQMAHGRHAPTHLVDIRRAGMNHIQDTDDGLRIGACVTATDLARNVRLATRLHDEGTITGNLTYDAPTTAHIRVLCVFATNWPTTTVAERAGK